MPLISTLGAASSRGFGEFNQQAQGNYIENFFNTYLYNGTGNPQPINSGISLSDTAAWTTYTQYIDGTNTTDIVVDSSGNFYVAGTANSTLFVAKYNSTGVLQWQRTLLQSGSSAGYGVSVDSSGNVYVAGQANNGTVNYGILAKYNSSGTIQWQRSLSDGASSLFGVVVASSGNIYVVGQNQPTALAQRGFVVKYNSSGTLQWKRQITGVSFSAINKVALDSSENVYVVGYLYDSAIGYSFLVAKYNSSGTIQWQKSVTDFSSASGNGIAIDSSNNIYVTGYSTDGSGQFFITIKYDTSGTLQWQRSLRDGGSIGYGVAVDSTGDVYVTGQMAGSGGDAYITVAKYNSSGTLQWQRKIENGTSKGYALAADASGNVFVACYATLVLPSGSTAQYGAVVKLKTDGTTLSGTASVSMIPGAATAATPTATSGAGTGTDGTATVTSATSTATDAAGTLTMSSATQNAVSGASGLVWIKGRSGATNHALYDTSRGATLDIASNLTTGQTTQTTGLTAFSASGFAIGSLAKLNTSSAIYAAWTFREQAKFFDVVTYTGNGANRTISHNLGSVPGMILIKRTDTTAAWAVYHRSLANTEYLVLNTTAAKATGTTYWNSTTPTATEFSLGTSTDVNANTGTYVAYLFAHDAGGFGLDGSQNVISCGSYTGNGTTPGPDITLGYEPQLILIKNASGATNWFMSDNMRGITTAGGASLLPNLTNAESAGAGFVNATSTGFSITTSNTVVNQNALTYVYMAIRRGPMKVPTDATTVFQPTVYTGTNVANRLVNTTIAPDLIWARQRNSTTFSGMLVGDRIRAQAYLATGSTATAVTSATALDQQIISTTEYGTAFSSMSGVWVGNDATAQLNASTTASNQIIESFKRAPGFLDMLTYVGNGISGRTVTHNLGAVPELMIVKALDTTRGWTTYAAPLGATKYLSMELTTGETVNSSMWNNTTPTSTQVTFGNNITTNGNLVNYVIYLLASVPGVSKIGSYKGTGTTQQINCGFTAGARLVLIKRTDSTGDWYIYDTARGIVAGNDPYILMNSTAAEVTSTDYVDAYSAGFELSSTAPAGLNETPGITWISRTSGFGTTPIRGLTYGGGLFVAVGSSGVLTTSPDAITWTSRTSGFGTTNIQSVAYGNGLYVAVGPAGTMTTSSDAITWTAQTSGFGTTAINAVTYGNGLFVAGGAASGGVTIMTTSTDGITWTQRTSGFSGGNSITGLTYGGGLFVAVGGGGSMSTSTDGITWTSRTSGFGSTTIRAVTYGNGLYVAVGDSGTMTTSTDGITWTSRTSGFGTTQILSVAYGNGLFVAAGASGTLTTSTNGITWTSRTSGFGAENIQALTYQNNIFVAGGTAGVMRASSPSYIYLAIA